MIVITSLSAAAEEKLPLFLTKSEGVASPYFASFKI